MQGQLPLCRLQRAQLSGDVHLGLHPHPVRRHHGVCLGAGAAAAQKTRIAELRTFWRNSVLTCLSRPCVYNSLSCSIYNFQYLLLDNFLLGQK